MSQDEPVSSPVPPPFVGNSLSSHCRHCGRALKSQRSKKEGICGPCFYDRRLVRRWNSGNELKFLKGGV